MRSFLLFLLALVSWNKLTAQSDFLTAEVIEAGISKTGIIGSDQRYYYYKTLMPADGTVKVYIEGTHTGGSAGSFSFYAYDKSRRQIAYKGTIGNSGAVQGDIVRDTIEIHSRAADSIYLLLYQGSSRSYNVNIRYEVTDQSANDPEPNGSFGEARTIGYDVTASGHLGYEADGVTDRYDYYSTLLPDDGTVKIYLQGIHTGGSAGSFSVYVYDKSRRQIAYKSIIGNSSAIKGETVSDSLTVYSRAADSIYILLYQGSARSYSYGLRYTITDRNPNDPEPNNSYAAASPLNMDEVMDGQLGYEADGVTDRYDYYKTQLPADGTVKVYLEGTHTGGSAGSFSFYAYDKSQRQIAYKGNVGNGSATQGDTVYDTIYITSREADSIYLVLYQGSSRSYTYKMRYEVIDQSVNDPEPNGSFGEAVEVGHNVAAFGHLGYEANGVTDRYDYYKTLLPANGTVKVYLEGTHTGGSAGSFSFFAYDKSQRQIAYKGNVGNGSATQGDTVNDTIYITSRAADSVYILLYQGSTRSYSYTMRYEVIDQSPGDPEPNGSYGEAIDIEHNVLAVGHLGYEADGVTDRYDYYKTLLPADGTVKVYLEGTHTGGSAGSFSFYAYDKSRRQIGYQNVIGNGSAIQGNTVRDTIYITSREADSIYLVLYQGSTRSYSYTLRYEVIDQSDNDPEPNDSFGEAIDIVHNVSSSGHLGYIADGVTDRNDYYKTMLPADGTVTVYLEGTHTGGSAGSFVFYAYDRSRRQIAYLAIVGNGTATKGDIVRDTVEIPSRGADSLYFLVYQGSSRSYSYKIRYTMPDALEGDPEPNNTFNEAVEFVMGDTLRGLLGYVSNNVTDRYDYYKAGLPERSGVTVYIEGTHTGGSDGSFSFYAYDNARRQIGFKSVVGKNISAGETIRDTITVNCNSTDSLYITLYQGGNRSFIYNVRFEVRDNKPVAAFSYTRTGNEFGFVNKSKNSDVVLWKFGSNQTSTVNYPMQELTPGFYNIQLIATNATCNFKDTTSREITVSGVESFTPDTSGVGGDLMMTIYGGGLTAGTTVTLSGAAGTLTPKEIINDVKGRQLGAVFDLHFAQPGVYDLTVGFPSQSPVVYEKAFTINKMVYPETWSEVTGPAIWRTGREAIFNLVVGNRGNTMAKGAIVAMAWPRDVEVEWIGREHRPDPNEFTEIIMDDGEVIRTKNDVVQWIYDVNTTRPIDTFGVNPYNGYVKYFTIPMIPAGATIEIPFRASSTGSGNHTFKTYTVKPNQFGSCETFNIGNALTGPAAVELYINTLDILIDEIKAPPATKIPAQVAVKSLKVTQKHIDVSSKVLFHRMWAKWYGADDLTESEYYDYYKEGLAADEFAMNQLKDLAFDQTINLGVGSAANWRSQKLTNQLDAANKSMLQHADKSREYMSRSRRKQNIGRRQGELEALSREEAKLFEQALESGSFTIDELRKFEKWTDALQSAKDYKTAAGQLEALIKYVEENCPEHAAQLEKLKEMLNKEKDIIEEKEKDTETRTSYDPNGIYGPSGHKAARYVNNNDRQPFVIMFENVDTAKADAQIVQILDTLDRSKFDLSSFEFGNVTIGKKMFRVPKGRKQFMMEQSLVPDRNMNVRINASIDTSTGIVSWQFTSIDPGTGDLPDFDGFLPPNKDYPSGEGSVSYTVSPVRNLADGTEMISKASIIFDTNEPIMTNTWKNTIDAVQPVGRIRAQVLQDSLIVLNYSATDAGSGVDYFHLYMSADGGEWIPIPGGQGDSIIMFGDPGSTYRFYMEAQDKTGNRERKHAVGEAVVSLPKEPGISTGGELILYPVPSNGTINLEMDIPETQQVLISVYSASGQRVGELYNGTAGGRLKISRTLFQLSSGLYFVHASGSKGINQKKKLILVK